MDFSDYSFSPSTHAAFFKAEAELIRFDSSVTRYSFARYVRKALLAIDAIFAIRLSRDTVLSAVQLITSYGLIDWKYHGDIEKSLSAYYPNTHVSDALKDPVREAIRYMRGIEWISDAASTGEDVTAGTLHCIHEILLSGECEERQCRSFRTRFLPHKKGFAPSDIPSAVDDLCAYANTESFSPLGQASVIHHAFERIVPYESLMERTGLLFAFLPMFRRGLFSNGYMVPICWGGSIDRERRKVLRESSRIDPRDETYSSNRERWAVHNASNTYLSVVIADSLFSSAERLRSVWQAKLSHIPANSALDRVIDLLLAMPVVSIRTASAIIGKSYGATNEAMRQLSRARIIREEALDGRERVFVCDQSAAMITEFVDKLSSLSHDQKQRHAQSDDPPWREPGAEGGSAGIEGVFDDANA